MERIVSLKTLLLTTFCVVIALTSNAQRIKIGFRTGASISNLFENKTGVASVTYIFVPQGQVPGPNSPKSVFYTQEHNTKLIRDARVGYFYCLDFTYAINKKLDAEIGIGSSQKGIDMVYTIDDFPIYRKANFNYIIIPTILKYRFTDKSKYFLTAGLYTGILEHASIDPGNSPDRVYFEKPPLNKVDLGFVLGGGYRYPLTKKVAVEFDVRINTGMIGINSHKEDSFFSYHSKNISLEAGLKVCYAL